MIKLCFVTNLSLLASLASLAAKSPFKAVLLKRGFDRLIPLSHTAKIYEFFFSVLPGGIMQLPLQRPQRSPSLPRLWSRLGPRDVYVPMSTGVTATMFHKLRFRLHQQLQVRNKNISHITHRCRTNLSKKRRSFALAHEKS